MTNIFMNRNVLYSCTCEAQRSITRLYFCRHCLKLRCGECVSHEVDSHYCQNCLEYMPSPEARLKRNKCSNCFDCPSCMHTLSTRATSVQVPSPEDASKTVPKKVYYLVCGFCRWTSRDVGIPDQTTASGGWQEKENPDSKKIFALMEHYRMLAHKEKLEKERKKLSQRCSYLHFSDKYGISAVVARKLAGISPISVSSKEESKSTEELSIAEATSEFEALPEKYLSETLNLASICTLKQRLAHPQFQPVYTADLYPQQKYLHIKRSQRCKECEHNLSKPEYNPSSIKFKIQMAAFYHIPEIRIKTVPTNFKCGEECKFEVTLCNPTPHVAHVTFLPLETEADENLANIVLPSNEFVMSARDDTAEFDDTGDAHSFDDDPSVVTFRKSNKIGLLMTVKPHKKGDVKVAFRLKHDFINTVVQLQSDTREPQVVWLTHKLCLHLGTALEE